jgi:formylglycine-generating enzyme required for sulfatase activity
VRIFVLAMLAIPLAVGCRTAEKPSDRLDIDEPRTDGDDTGTESPDCTAFDMALEQAETVAPSVVRISFKLTCDGEPIPGKTEEDFTISEDGDSISVFESAQQIVPTVASFQLSSVLVLDMSGSMIESGNLPGLQIAANSFISTMGGHQSIAIYTFDGREDIDVLVPFTQDVDVLSDGIESLSSFEVIDTSTNLNGAVISSIGALDAEAALHGDKLFGGTIAIFTDGKDQAGRVSDESAAMAAEATGHAIYSIGLGGEIDTDHLDAIGKDGAFYSGDIDELSDSFSAVATDILNEANSLYVLAYCSPKRAGEHELGVALNDTTASITQGFSAEGFEGGCDPTDFVPPEFLDLDGDGFRPYDGDCDDDDASRYPGRVEDCDEVDNDCDGEIDEDVENTFFRDADEDGFGDAETTALACTSPDGFVDNDEDCDDTTALRAPGLTETCDDLDNDCDDEVDEGLSSTYFMDADRDGYGDAGDSVESCDPGSLYVDNDEDCDDTTALRAPGLTETCDDLDNDCDDEVDEGVLSTFYRDADGDGHGDAETTTAACGPTTDYVASSDDCDDGSSDRAPGHTEVCDGIDNDCDDAVDEGLMGTYYFDGDGDGYGDPATETTACSTVGSYVTNDDDCDDSTAMRAPGLSEICDGIDNDCDESVDEGLMVTYYRDWDGDGYGDPDDSIIACSSDGSYVTNDDDCDDADGETSPDAIEECDGEDNDCDGVVDDGECGSGDEYVAAHGGTMILIAAQTFEMGCTAGMSSCSPDESPAHFVTLTNDFYIGETEVTQGEYEAMMGTNPSYFSGDYWIDTCGSDCPVEMLSWHMAAAFANAVSDSEGLEQCYTCTGSGTSTDCSIAVEPYSCGGYRLPTEAEWEAAARCGEDTVYAGSTVIGDVAWYNGNSESTTHTVATKASNACGLYDMSGNVFEWTQDWYSSSYYGSSPGTDPVGATSGGSRVVRSGSWNNFPTNAFVAARWRFPTTSLDFDYGLRLLRTIPSSVGSLGSPGSSCLNILEERPSVGDGYYWIDPSGSGSDKVYCDMTTMGGGWTLVFEAEPLMGSSSIGYTYERSTIRASSDEVLIAYRSTYDLGDVSNPYRFSRPHNWIAASPMSYAGEISTVTTTDAAGTTTTGTLYYGYQNWGSGSYCSGSFTSGLPDHGKICIDGTNAPFYNGFSRPEDPPDWCSLSDEFCETSECTDERVFTIAMR